MLRNITYSSALLFRLVAIDEDSALIRAHQAEDILKGESIKERLIAEAAQVAAEEASPISDIRAPAEYRKHMVKALTTRALRQATAPN